MEQFVTEVNHTRLYQIPFNCQNIRESRVNFTINYFVY